MIDKSDARPRMGIAVNDGSFAEACSPKESVEVHDEKLEAQRQWARDNFARVAAEAQALTAKIASPDVEGDERKQAKKEREAMMGRLRAMQSLLS